MAKILTLIAQFKIIKNKINLNFNAQAIFKNQIKLQMLIKIKWLILKFLYWIFQICKFNRR